jgi:hypothetical protein
MSDSSVASILERPTSGKGSGRVPSSAPFDHGDTAIVVLLKEVGLPSNLESAGQRGST